MSYSSSGSFPNYGATNPRQGGIQQSPVRTATSRYHQLCDSISSSIFAINNAGATAPFVQPFEMLCGNLKLLNEGGSCIRKYYRTTALEQSLKQLGTAADSPLLRDKIHNTQLSCNNDIRLTTNLLKELTATIQRGDRQQRVQLERLRNEFQETIQRYSSFQKQVATKMKYGLTLKPKKPVSGWSFEDDTKADEEQSLLEAEKLQQQRHLQSNLEFEQQIFLEREQQIRQIEADMLDVNQVFRDLAALVHEQGEVIDTIEGNVETAADNTARGTEELGLARNYQKKYRTKLCILVVICVVIVLVIVLIIVLNRS